MSMSNSSTWSPFTCLPKATLTPSGLLKLDTQDQEVELIRCGPVELRYDGVEPMGPCPRDITKGVWENRNSDLTVTVTTHRLVCMDRGDFKKPQARFLHLSNLHVIQESGGPTLMSPNATYKLILSTYTFGDLILAFKGSSGGGGIGIMSNSYGGAKKDRDAMTEQIQKALDRKAWEMATRLQEQQQATNSLAKRRVGVDHILTKNKLKHQQAKKLADEALSGDAEQLLQEASALLQVIQKYTTLLQKKQTLDGDQEEDDEDAMKLSGLLQDMGMTAALTKDQIRSGGLSSSGRRRRRGEDLDRAYYELVARQVVDFLSPKLPQMGGILSLTDVFCLFNRARGSNLISPEDLKQACNLLVELNLGISQRTFPSGIVVLQLDDQFNQTANSSGNSKEHPLVALCPTTALEASHVLKLSPLLALEQLEDAERQGLLCRDTTLETTRFYPNYFVTQWQD